MLDTLANSDFKQRMEKLCGVVVDHDVPVDTSPTQRNGDVKSAVLTVLQDAKDSMTVKEVYVAVLEQLERGVPYSSVKNVLSSGGRDSDSPIEKVGYGRYEYIDKG